MNIIMELYRQKKKNVKIILKKETGCFGVYKIFIQKLLIKLWENPKLIFLLLTNADLKEFKEYLAPFIVDNFYNNYLSGNYLENNLLYVITLMLQNEIEKFNDIGEFSSFLDGSKCGYLLQQLINKIDIQIYFKKMILGTIIKIENCSSRKINFNVNEISKKLSWLKSEKTFDAYNTNILKNAKNSYRHGSNTNNYLINVNIQYLEKMEQNEEVQKNKDMNDFLGKLIDDIKKKEDPNLYSNSVLIQNLQKLKSATEVLAIYNEQINEIFSFINKLIEDLNKNIFLIPHSVKCICKIIFTLIKKKFRNIKTVEINAFISKFFLDNLLIPIISSPAHNAHIKDFVISEITLKNIKTTNIILSKLFSGRLFHNDTNEGNFTSFNAYFLEKMPDILFFFKKVTEVKLPLFIENLLQEELKEKFEYDYLEQNKEIIYTNISFVYKIDNLEILVRSLQKCPEISENNSKENNKDSPMEKFKNILNKFLNKQLFKDLKEVEKKIKNDYLSKFQPEKDKKEKQISINDIECYFFYFEEIYEKKYEYIFKLESTESYYYMDLKALKNNNLNNNQRILVNTKNYLSATLANYRLLDISDLNQDNLGSTISILEEIKKYITLPNYILNNNAIPLEWYINTLLDNLPLLDNSYKENDFMKLYKELYEDLCQKIEMMNFHYLISLKNRIKFIDKAKHYYDTIENCEKDIVINEKIKVMAENFFLPVEVQFKYDDCNKDLFSIKYSNLKEKTFENKSFIHDPKKDIYIFRTIESLASNFPNLVEYETYQDENPLEIMSKLKIPQVLKEYFKLISEKILSKDTNNSKKDSNNLYKAKIEDYFMNKIYDKIYPIEPNIKDVEIYSKAIMLSWVEPNMIINKDYIYETSLPDIIHQFQNFNLARTPQKKFDFIQKILDLINNLIIFNEGNKKEINLDNSAPVFFYIFIKAHPYKIYTDLEFIKLFLDLGIGKYSFNIKQFESAIDILISCDEKNFKLSKEEYTKRCNSMTKNMVK